MKTLFSVFICMLVCTDITLAQQNTPAITGKNVPDFDKWTEEQIQEWEDSVKNALYPEAVIGYMSIPAEKLSKAASSATVTPLNFINSHVPDSYPIDQTKDVGEIPMTSSLTPSGAMTYEVPIGISPGKQGFQPQLSITYNSLAGNGVVGIGWNIGGR